MMRTKTVEIVTEKEQEIKLGNEGSPEEYYMKRTKTPAISVSFSVTLDGQLVKGGPQKVTKNKDNPDNWNAKPVDDAWRRPAHRIDRDNDGCQL
jgi:hypothetical protein